VLMQRTAVIQRRNRIAAARSGPDRLSGPGE